MKSAWALNEIRMGALDEWCKPSAVPQDNYRAAMRDDAIKVIENYFADRGL
jgi:hypothetical protein